jgi:hypothetical protein
MDRPVFLRRDGHRSRTALPHSMHEGAAAASGDRERRCGTRGRRRYRGRRDGIAAAETGRTIASAVAERGPTIASAVAEAGRAATAKEGGVG